MITVKHTFHAAIETVWDLWNDSESIKEWWSPRHFTAPVIKNDFREGGDYLFSMRAPDGAVSWNSGTYQEIVPLKKIVSIMSFCDENGNFIKANQLGLPGDWPDHIKISVMFEAKGAGTTVTIEESGIPPVMESFAKMGWQQQFEKFDALLFKQKLP